MTYVQRKRLGIDDWAWRRGQRYGTIVVDLERGEVIDLLPDRDAATVAKWLKEHPGIELVSRDRSSAYAQAATEGASEAQQVADRWHLLKNCERRLNDCSSDTRRSLVQHSKPSKPLQNQQANRRRSKQSRRPRPSN